MAVLAALIILLAGCGAEEPKKPPVPASPQCEPLCHRVEGDVHVCDVVPEKGECRG